MKKEQATEEIADRHSKVDYRRDWNAKGCILYLVSRGEELEKGKRKKDEEANLLVLLLF